MNGKGPVITCVVAVAAIAAVVGAFMTNANPYVTIAQARAMKDDQLHVAGEIVPGTVQQSLKEHALTFMIKDAEGATITVIHRGDQPANISEATKVVAIGGMSGDSFVSQKLLVKCPSKYEGDPKTSQVAKS